MSRQTPELLLLAAIVNSLDPNHHKQWGIIPEHFTGYRDEFEWLEAFGKAYERTPTHEEFKTKWPDITLSTEQMDGKWPAEEVIDGYNSRTVLRTFTRAGALIKQGEVRDALEMIRTMETHAVVDPPTNALVDYSFLDDYDTPEDRIALPWKTLQSKTDGMGVGELWYVAARPSQGKSAHTAVMAAKAAMEGRRVIVYSMEMTKRAVQVRLQAILAHMLGIKVSARDMRSRRWDPLEYKRLMQEIESAVPGEIHVHTPKEGPCRPSVVRARAGDYDLNVVDYIGLMKPDGNGRAVDDWRVMAAISNELKEIALGANTRMLVASQINREGDNSLNPPKLKNLSQSDALGQDGDVVLTLMKYRRQAGATHFSIEKQRDGEADVQFWSRFDVDTGNYDEITRDEADELTDNWGDD